MIRSIMANPIGRKILATTLFTTSVLATNAMTTQDNKDKIANAKQVELVSPEFARATATNAVRLETFSIEHNKKLDKIYIENCEQGYSKKYRKENLDAMYRVYGTYGATIEIQRAVDSQFIENTFNSFLDHYELTNNERERAKETFSLFYGWQDNILFSDLFKEELKMYEEQDFPSAEKAISYIDKHIDNKEFFTEKDKKMYNEQSKMFESMQIDKNTPQAKSDLLAYKVHLIHIFAFHKFFNENPIPEKSLFWRYFSRDFVNGEAAIKPQISSK